MLNRKCYATQLLKLAYFGVELARPQNKATLVYYYIYIYIYIYIYMYPVISTHVKHCTWMSITCVCVCVHYSHDPHVIRFMFECMCYSCCNVYERCTQSAYALCMHECAMHSVGVVMHCGELLTPCPGGSRRPTPRGGRAGSRTARHKHLYKMSYIYNNT